MGNILTKQIGESFSGDRSILLCLESDVSHQKKDSEVYSIGFAFDDNKST
jgi:hypothetical protein